VESDTDNYQNIPNKNRADLVIRWTNLLHVYQCTGMPEPNEEFHPLTGQLESRS